MPDRIAPTVVLLVAAAACAIHSCAKTCEDEHARQLSARVRTEFLHAWNNYERYAWGHDALRPLSFAEDLGNRLLPVFNSPTQLPYVYVNLRTGQTRGPVTNPAETGTLLLEFGTLSKLTGKPVFYEKAKRALAETFKRRSPLGLVGESINVEPGAWTTTDSHISGGIDSYYEYLWKCWLLFGDKDCRDMWDASIPAVNKYLPDEIGGGMG